MKEKNVQCEDIMRGRVKIPEEDYQPKFSKIDDLFEEEYKEGSERSESE